MKLKETLALVQGLLRLDLANPPLGGVVKGLDILLPLVNLESQDASVISKD